LDQAVHNTATDTGNIDDCPYPIVLVARPSREPVTPAQVLAARLAIELSEEDGESPSEALKALADADVAASQPPAPGHPTSAEEPGLSEIIDRLQGVEQQLEELHLQASRQERSEPSNEPKPQTRDEQSIEDRTIEDPTLATVEPEALRDRPGDVERDKIPRYPWNRGTEGDLDLPAVGSPEQPKAGQLEVGAGAQEPLVGRYINPTGMSDQEVDEIIAEDEQKHPERYRRGRGEGEGRDSPGPWSRGIE
jgi:hypothetical protein